MAEQLEWRSAKLLRTRDLTRDIRLFEIEPAGDFVIPKAGSHINVTVQIAGRPDVRSYSTVGPCADGIYRIAVKLLGDSRGGSAYMWSLAPGAHLTISTPGNHFDLSRNRPEYLLLAGGIGITPIYCMVKRLVELKRPWQLHYSNRSRADAAFLKDLSQYGDCRFHFDDESAGKFLPIGEIVAKAPKTAHFYCGPTRPKFGT